METVLHKNVKIMMAAGGTGGHIYPAIAIATEFKRQNGDNEIIFVGTKNGLENTIVLKEGFKLEHISANKWKAKSIFGKIKTFAILPKSFIESFLLLKKYEPEVVIGTGGYCSVIFVFTAFLFGYKTFILEENSIAGLANRVLGKFVDKIFISFKESAKWFNDKKTIYSGNPLRREIVEGAIAPNVQNENFTLMVVGGSQGAVKINRSFVEALKNFGDLARNLKIIHQTGSINYDETRSKYNELNIKADIRPYFDDIWNYFKKADLVISRAGSGIVEICAFAKPSILIPFPYSADNHQEENARILERAGCAIVIKDSELNGEVLSKEIRGFINSKQKVKDFSENAKKIAKLNATQTIMSEITKTL